MTDAKQTPAKKIAILRGSPRPDGVSAAVVATVIDALPAGVEAVAVDYMGFPLYHPGAHLAEPGDPDGADLPEPVRAAFRQIRDADAVIIATSEYNYGIPGSLKNALDWLSRPAYRGVFAGRRVAVLSASPSPTGGLRAQTALKRVLVGLVAQVFVYPEVSLAGPFARRGEDGRLTDQDARKRVSDLVEAFMTALSG